MVLWRLSAVGCGTERVSANLHLRFIVCASLCWSTAERTRLSPYLPPSLPPPQGHGEPRPYVCGSRSGMDQGSAAGPGGTFITLSDTEQRCYSGLYALCQPDSSGKLAAGKVAELFRASQLPAETLHQVSLRGTHRRACIHIALQISDICCVWMCSQYVAVHSGKSKVKGPGCALRAFIVQ